MNAADREQLRLSLLRHLDANPSRFGLAIAYLLQMCRNEGRTGLAEGDVLAELMYLADKGLVEIISKTISPELLLWRITASGRDLVAGAAI